MPPWMLHGSSIRNASSCATPPLPPTIQPSRLLSTTTQNHPHFPMDYSCFTTDIASPPYGLDQLLSQELLDTLWSKDILNFDDFLDIPASTISSGPRENTSEPKGINRDAFGHLQNKGHCTNHSNFSAENDTEFIPVHTMSTGALTDLIAQPNQKYPVSKQ